MKRRTFLQALGATALVPLVPGLATPLAASPVAPASVTLTAQQLSHYKWAETIVRAHNKSSIAFLQRHLRLDTSSAKAIQSALIDNGVVMGRANAYGIHQAVKPLHESAYLRPQKKLDIDTQTASETTAREQQESAVLEDEAILSLMLAASTRPV